MKNEEGSMKKYTEHTMHYDAVCKFLRHPETDQDIIELQDILLTTGVHSFMVSDTAAARTVIATFISSLNHYQAIGFVSSMIPKGLAVTVNSVYPDLIYCLHSPDLLYDFILNDLMCDFIWIEYEPSLLPFIDALIDLNIHREMPILIVTNAAE